MTETQVRRMKSATLKLYSHSLLGIAMSRLLVSLLLAITTFGPAHSQFVTAREYSAATSDGRARPFVWSIEGEGAASLPAKHPSGFKLCSVAVTTVGSPVYIFELAQFRFAGDAPDGFVTLLTKDGHFIRTEPLSETLGGTALVTFSAFDRPLPGPQVYSVLAAKLPEVPVGGWRCNVTVYEYIE
jgi:hypothetical protein